MFEVYSWSYRFIYILIISLYCILSMLIVVKRNVFLGIFLPILNLVITLSSFLLLSIYSTPMDLKAIYIGSAIILIYIITRIILIKILHLNKVILYDLVFLLISIGSCILYRLSPDYALKQILFISFSNFIFILTIVLARKIEIHPHYWKYFTIIIFGLLILTQIFGSEVFGSKNWIIVGIFSFQPSEIIKILFIFLIACLFNDEMNIKRFIINTVIVMFIVLFFALQKDLGSAFIFFTTYIFMLFYKDLKFYYTGFTILSAAISGVASYFLFGHIQSRVQAWISPWKYPSTKAYQITQSLFAIATGGLLGTGIYGGNPKYIPAVHNDFIFSAICEEMGIIVAICILFIYSLIILISMNICLECKDRLYQLVCLGLTTLTAIQTLLIVCGVLNLIPITGVTLPFISYGGSSLLSQFINLGLIFYISEKDKSESYE